MGRRRYRFLFMLLLAMVSAGSVISTLVTSQSDTTTPTKAVVTGQYTYPLTTQHASFTTSTYVYGPGKAIVANNGANGCGWFFNFNATQGQQFQIRWDFGATSDQIELEIAIAPPAQLTCSASYSSLFSKVGNPGSVDWVAPSNGQFFAHLFDLQNFIVRILSGTVSIEASTVLAVASTIYATATTTQTSTTSATPYIGGSTAQLVTGLPPSSGNPGPVGIMIGVGAVALLGSIAVIARRKKIHTQEKNAVSEERLRQTPHVVEEHPDSMSVPLVAVEKEVRPKSEVSLRQGVQSQKIKKIPPGERRISASVAQPTTEIINVSPQPTLVPEIKAKISTGYADLDALLAGGLPRGFAILVVSPPCDERDLLLRKLIGSSLSAGCQVFYVSGDAGRVQDLIRRFKTDFIAFSPDSHRISSSAKNLHDIPGIGNLVEFNILLNKGLGEGLKEGEAKLLIMDLVSDVLVRYRGAMTRKWLADFIGKRRAQNYTNVCILNPAIASKEESSRIIDLFDGIIEINEKESEGRLRRFLAVRKMYGQEYSESELQLDRSKLF